MNTRQENTPVLVQYIKLAHRAKQGQQDCARLRSTHLPDLHTCQHQLRITPGSEQFADEPHDGIAYDGEAAHEKRLSIPCNLEPACREQAQAYNLGSSLCLLHG